ncbi:hypothetical protein BSZ35_00290 [Salinibacter sp. 10B]|nr:hypothetical protein BSZ35_00290 [Salinibacter sp. 10B]
MKAQSPEHEAMLPENVPPIPRPESRAEARLLLLCLEVGLIPTYKHASEGSDSKTHERQKGNFSQANLGLSEAEVMARGA